MSDTVTACLMLVVLGFIAFKWGWFFNPYSLEWYEKAEEIRQQRLAHQLELEGELVDILLTNIPDYMKIWTDEGFKVPMSSFRNLLRDPAVTIELKPTEVVVRGTHIPEKCVRLDRSLFSFK